MNPKYKNTSALALRTDQKSNHAEKHKYLFELMKHMTTLSSGSVLLLVTFLEKVLHDKAPSVFIKLAFVGFCVSILTAVCTMLILASNPGGKIADKDKNDFLFMAITAIMGFFAGISFLMISAYRSY